MPKLSKYPYVYWHEPSLRWYARIRFRGKLWHLGFFMDQELAHKKVDEVVQRLKLASSGEELMVKREARHREKRIDVLFRELEGPKPLAKKDDPDTPLEKRVQSIFDEDKST